MFCSVPDPVLGLRELGRVVRPEGRILLLEHVRSDHPPCREDLIFAAASGRGRAGVDEPFTGSRSERAGEVTK